MPGLRFVAVAVAAIVFAAGSSAASAATVAQPRGVGTAVREFGGTIVFSEYAQTERRWYLSVREVGSGQRRLAVAPSPVPFDADIGTDSKGRPQLIYQRCAGTASAPTGCELFVFSLASATGERPVRNANDPGRNDVGPTLWRGRIAWTREYGAGKDANPVVYTKLLTAPRSQPSTRLPGVPTTRCAQEAGLVEPPCGTTTYRLVSALELWGDNLGLIVRYVFDGLGGISQAEVRLVRVSERSAQQVDFLVSGLNGQSFAGPSFFSGRLAWYRTCGFNGEARSCRTFAGPWRYGLSTRRYERGAPGPIRVSGFADTGTRLYEVVSCPDASLGVIPAPPPAPACAITSVAPPAYHSVAQPDLASAQPPTQYTQIAAGDGHTCALTRAGKVVCRGYNRYGQTRVPAGVYTAVTAGEGSTCALTRAGTARCWGTFRPFREKRVPAGSVQIDEGGGVVCVVSRAGKAVCLSDKKGARTRVPAGLYKQVVVGDGYACGLRRTGKLSCWNLFSARTSVVQTVPPGTFTQISSKFSTACALATGGAAVCWGDTAVEFGLTAVPPGSSSQVAAGYTHACALTRARTVVCWGRRNAAAVREVPSGTFAQIVSGKYHACGLTRSGKVVCWGSGFDPRKAF